MSQQIPPAELDRISQFIADVVAKKLANQPRLVDRQSLPDIIQLSLATIDRRVREGKIPCIKSGSRVLFDPAAVVAALANGEADDRT